jgi:hypothetical protein
LIRPWVPARQLTTVLWFAFVASVRDGDLVQRRRASNAPRTDVLSLQERLADKNSFRASRRRRYFSKTITRKTNLTDEQTDLLREIRNLLIPIADHYQVEYEDRQAARFKERQSKVKDLLSTAARKKAWQLADGSRTQREISKQAGLDEGATSKFFKQVRDLGAIAGANPTRTMDVD